MLILGSDDDALGDLPPVVEALTGIGLRDRVKVMVGGAPVTQAFTEEIGADVYGKDAGAATRLAKQFLGIP